MWGERPERALQHGASERTSSKTRTSGAKALAVHRFAEECYVPKQGQVRGYEGMRFRAKMWRALKLWE